LIKLTFIGTVFHILNRNLPLGMEVWPPGSLAINPFDYLKCGVSRRGINRSSYKKNSPYSPPSWRSSATSQREATKRACSHFLPRLEKVVCC
jgi:hypothetical protein